MLNVLMDFSRFLSTDLDDILSGPFLSTIILIILLIIFVIVIKILSIKALKNPLETPKGLFGLFIMFVNFIENLVVDIMGERNRGFSKIIVPISMYLFFAFLFGLTGLPSPVTNIAFPLILAFLTFGMIHGTAMKYNKLNYFHRFVEPIAVFLPINILTMWAPLLSLSLRLFGNATAGYCLMSVFYYGLASLGSMITGTTGAVGAPWGPASFLFPAPITAVLHIYFDLFSAFIQTTVFIMLTMIFVYQEQPEDINQVIDDIQYQN